jgi:hypothetical protein
MFSTVIFIRLIENVMNDPSRRRNSLVLLRSKVSSIARGVLRKRRVAPAISVELIGIAPTDVQGRSEVLVRAGAGKRR